MSDNSTWYVDFTTPFIIDGCRENLDGAKFVCETADDALREFFGADTTFNVGDPVPQVIVQAIKEHYADYDKDFDDEDYSLKVKRDFIQDTESAWSWNGISVVYAMDDNNWNPRIEITVQD